MRHVLLLLLAIVSVTAAIAQESPPWSLGAFYQFRDKSTSVVAYNRIDTFDDALKVKWLDIDLSAFVGTGPDQTPIGGAITMRLPVADNLSFNLGVGISKNVANFEQFFKDFKDFRLGAAVSVVYTKRF